ncbi:sulfatase-like hydrolase/transferase [Pirellulales bacterium]|nr:sulfatase-like hydrolase/transferase [Pirellulales bacterium]
MTKRLLEIRAMRFVIVVSFILTGGGSSTLANPPNIVLIMADDMAWAGTSLQKDPNVPDSKSDFHQTPTLELLASQGMAFSNSYSAGPICSPTRAAIQTGITPAQLRVTTLRQAGRFDSGEFTNYFVGHPLTPPQPRRTLINPGETTLAEMVKSADPNYVTGLFGKEDWFPKPTLDGYDEFQHFLPNNVFPDDDPAKMFSIADAGMDFMERQVQANKPFFTFLGHYGVKTAGARPETLAEFENLPPGEKHDNPLYAAGHKDLDTTIGMVLNKISELGIEDNTYILFSSDHGASTNGRPQVNDPLYGGKGTLFEGGVRVPLLIKGPGITPGSISAAPVSTIDYFPTIYELAGGTGQLGERVDGTSIANVLLNNGHLPAGQSTLQRPRAENGELFFHYPHYGPDIPIGSIKPMSTVLDGDYKLVRVYGENGQPDDYMLFDLSSNLSESIDPNSPLNLASQMPGKVAQLKSKLDAWLQATDASLPYDVRDVIELHWAADQPGSATGVPNVWRSMQDVDFFDREVWLPQENAAPLQVDVAPFQPRLPAKAFDLNGSQGFSHRFFHVSDADPTSGIDNDHSASFAMWVRLDGFAGEQMLFETGTDSQGISLTLGDADGDSVNNDLRFRVLGQDGAEVTATAVINRFADPTQDFVQIAAVINDSDSDRHVEIYLNGALAARVDGVAGPSELDWDGLYRASIGRFISSDYNGVYTDTFGGASGGGELPFSGGNLNGQVASFEFYNYTLSSTQVLAAYNSKLHPADHGIQSVAGTAEISTTRPGNVSLDQTESASLLVTQERDDVLDAAVAVDAVIAGGATLDGGEPGTPRTLPVGTAITSYLLHFDPMINNGLLTETVAGSVVFSRDILAVIYEPTSLADSDPMLGSIGDYGLESDRGLMFDVSDFATISNDRRTLFFNFSVAGDELLQFRVLTDQAIAADFDRNGIVDSFDLGVFEAAYGVDANADADFDGDSDGFDFLTWQRQLTEASDTENATAVPEPQSGLPWIVGISGLLMSRRLAWLPTAVDVAD